MKKNLDNELSMAVNKRKREVADSESNVKRPKTKKRLSNRKKKTPKIVPATNKYESLPSDPDPDSDSDIVYDYNKKDARDIVLNDKDSDSDSDSEDVVIVSDAESEEKPDSRGDDEVKIESDEPEETETNELSKNNDFIGFDFASSEDEGENDHGNYSDDGVISNDEGVHINAVTPTSLYPWIRAHDHSKQQEIADWLTMEMKDFVNYISPAKEEILARNLVVKNLKKQINVCWPDAEAHVFGSFATDLYLPGSDIDMVVISKNGDCENRHKLYQLSSFLRQKKLAKDIEVIAGAKVPIIKFVDPKTNIHIDVSFERTNGLDAARRIRRWLEHTEGLRELVLVVKQFLRSRKLNNVHVGGLGGYATIILCYHFLNMHPRISTDTMSALSNLGSLLIEFFELYGRNFSYDNLVIAFESGTDTPKYIKKTACREIAMGRNPFSIIVQDPDDPSNNITRSSYNLRDVKKAFGGAYQILADRCYYLNSASYKKRIGQLILGDIIKFKGKERDFNDDRKLVVNDALIQKEEEVEIIDDEENKELAGDYFSEVTVESDDDLKKEGPKQDKKQYKPVSEYLSVNDESSSDEDSEKKSLPKDQKRDFWKRKGIEFM